MQQVKSMLFRNSFGIHYNEYIYEDDDDAEGRFGTCLSKVLSKAPSFCEDHHDGGGHFSQQLLRHLLNGGLCGGQLFSQCTVLPVGSPIL